MNVSRLPRWGVWAAVFILAAGALGWWIHSHKQDVTRLADGRSVRVLAVTYGTNHLFETGPVWARLAHRLGAINWARRLGYQRYAAPTRTSLPSLMVWVAFPNPYTNPIPRYASVADVQGAETEPGYQAVVIASPQTPEAMAAWRFDNFPRRQRRLRIRLYEYDLFQVRARYLGELPVENPVRAVTPVSPEPPLSTTLRDGPLECSLLALRAGEPPPVTARNSPAQWTSAEFTFRENNQPTTNWTVKRFEALGVDGNRIVPITRIVTLAGERRVVRFPGPLWPEEPEWQVTAEFVRTRDFPTTNLWTFRLPSACLAERTFATNLTAAADGLEQPFLLQLQIGLPFGVVSSAPRQANLALKYTPAGQEVYLDLTRVTDDTGSDCLAAAPYATRHGWLDAQLKLPATAAHVDLTFALHRSRTFTFRVRAVPGATNAMPGAAANTNRL
jgi:hypothetical protein